MSHEAKPDPAIPLGAIITLVRDSPFSWGGRLDAQGVSVEVPVAPLVGLVGTLVAKWQLKSQTEQPRE